MLKLKILLIDDEEDYCMIMKSFFKKKNYEVFTAYTLKSGLELIDNVKPDILFLDNNLPDGFGFTHVESIVEKNPHLKLYLVSAYYKKGDLFYSSPNVIAWEKPISISLLNNTF